MPTDFENAVEAFKKADEFYKSLDEYISSGQVVADIVKSALGVDAAQQQWRLAWDRLRAALEERNVKLREAKDALRSAVQLSQTQWRGPNGAASSLSAGDFKANSVTIRTFNPQSLFTLVNNKGKLQELLALTKIDKDGKVVSAAKQDWKFEYETILNWLKANGMEDIISGAYEEIERTPQVKGPKALGFLGEKKDD